MGVCTGLTLSDPRFAELDLAVQRHSGRADAVLYVLERAKYLFGALPILVMHHIADGLHLSHGDVYQAVAFYDFFATRPLGAHTVSVCLGTHCYMNGTATLFDRLQAELGVGPGETTPDGLFTLIVCYAGEDCGDEPGFFVDGERFTVRPEAISEVLNSFRPASLLAGIASDTLA